MKTIEEKTKQAKTHQSVQIRNEIKTLMEYMKLDLKCATHSDLIELLIDTYTANNTYEAHKEL